jgi:excinuclease ABC subunit C
MKDQHNEVLYVGKAKSLKQRVVSYFRKNQQHANKVLRLVYNVVDFETIETDTELDALLLECRLIQAFHPIYNRQMNHSANYCFVDLTNHSFTITQTPQIGSYGPFRQTKKLPVLFQLLSETFQLPTVNELTLLTLRKQLPQMEAYPLEEKWREIGCFFCRKEDRLFFTP